MRLLGLDLSEGHARAVVVGDAGDVVARADRAPDRGGLAAAARDAVKGLGKAVTGVEAAGVAVALAGDALPADVADTLAGALKARLPVHAVSAGAASVLAETWLGAAAGTRDAVALVCGERVAAATMIGGRVVDGAHGLAGSVGWLALNPVEREDYRRHGGLEAEVSAAGIVRRLVWRVKAGDRSRVVDEVGGDLGRLTAAHVFEGARRGDGVSISVVRDTAKYVGMAVANLVSVVDPEVVVLAGPLADAGDLLLEPIRAECARRLRPAQAERVAVLLSTLGADGVAIGAARRAGQG
ncbi:MAG: ROK family protein [Acidobacteriota bacterium]